MGNSALSSQVILQGSKYKIVKFLGQGGFGITYEGLQMGLNRKVAIKEFFIKGYCTRLSSTDVSITNPDMREMMYKYQNKFRKEARMIADLNHENIVKIFDVFEENNTVYYVMEHIEGGSLQDCVEERGPLSERKALAIIRKVADALAFVHQHKILHLDLKPDNVMMRNENTPVLIDFGISKHYSESGEQTTTSGGAHSRGYAPLEQYVDGGVTTFSPSTDIYSLGATLLFLLTGKRPPEAQVVNAQGLPPFPKGLSEATCNAITAAMRPRRAERPQSVSDFLKILDGGEVVVNTDSQIRQVIEQLEIQGEYKEAYLRCVECLEKGIEVEFAQKKCEYLIPLMRKKNKSTSQWMIIAAIAFTVLFFIAIVFLSILTN